MPKYDEIIKQSADNLKSLGKKLKELDKLNKSIQDLKDETAKVPEEFERKFKEIVTLSKKYTELLGEVTSTYLEGNNKLFTSKLSELSEKNTELKKQIVRLEKVDLTDLFNKLQATFFEKTRIAFEAEFKKIDTKTENFQSKINDLGQEITRIEQVDLEQSFDNLQKIFIEKTRDDLELELTKIDAKTNELQNKITEFENEINRLKEVDLEKHFEKHQKTLADVFNAINNINISLTGITSSLNTINRGLGENQEATIKAAKDIKDVLDQKFEATQKSVKDFKEIVEHHLHEQDKKRINESQSIRAEIDKLAGQNALLQKETKKNRWILIVGIVVIVLILISILLK